MIDLIDWKEIDKWLRSAIRSHLILLKLAPISNFR